MENHRRHQRCFWAITVRLIAEVRLLEHLRQLGFLYTVREISPWISEGPGVAYVMANTWLQLGRIEVAVGMFEVVAGSFGMFYEVKRPKLIILTV